MCRSNLLVAESRGCILTLYTALSSLIVRAWATFFFCVTLCALTGLCVAVHLHAHNRSSNFLTCSMLIYVCHISRMALVCSCRLQGLATVFPWSASFCRRIILSCAVFNISLSTANRVSVSLASISAMTSLRRSWLSLVVLSSSRLITRRFYSLARSKRQAHIDIALALFCALFNGNLLFILLPASLARSRSSSIAVPSITIISSITCIFFSRRLTRTFFGARLRILPFHCALHIHGQISSRFCYLRVGLIISYLPPPLHVGSHCSRALRLFFVSLDCLMHLGSSSWVISFSLRSTIPAIL